MNARDTTDTGGAVVAFNAARVVFGAGASSETGEHLRQLGVTRAFVVCDRFVNESALGDRIQESLRAAGVEPVLYDGVVGEPNEASVQEAVEAARGGFDGFVGIGGGSALDTAKLCALFATHGGELLDYVNAPIGAGRAVPGPVLPVVALPTTSGTGSEVTTVAIVDFPRLGTKTGISHGYLRPSLAIVDPSLTVSCPPGVTASTGLDALLHALEAYTVSAYDTRPHLPPGQRPPYQGANPFSDPLCERAIELVGGHLRSRGLEWERRRGAHRAGAGVDDRRHRLLRRGRAHPARPRLSDRVAQARVATAGLRRGSARPSRLRRRRDRARRLPVHPGRGARAMRNRGTAARRRRRPRRLARAADDQDVGAPTRLGELGYGEDDLAPLVSGAVDQRRLLVGAPKKVGADRARAAVEGVAVTEPASGWPSRVAVVGAGTMGVGIAHVLATSAIPTVLVDATAEQSEAALTRALELLRRLEAEGNVDPGRHEHGRAPPARGRLGRGRRPRRRPGRRGRRRARGRQGSRLCLDRGCGS